MAYILIADDDELVAEIACRTLTDTGHICGWIANAAQAWDLLHTGRRPDLFLLDQDMPGMSGMTLLGKLRGSPIHYDLPVVMFTAKTGIEDEAQAIHGGAQGFVRKPFVPEILVSRVNQVLAKREEHSRQRDQRTVLAGNGGYARAARMQASKLTR